jgi:hypothetical protein
VTTQGESTTARRTSPQPLPEGQPTGRPPWPRKGPSSGLEGLVESLAGLRDTVRNTHFVLPLLSAKEAETAAKGIVSQLNDYLLPRLERLDAPLLVVVGGSTGAGKSTLVNSLVRAPVSPAGVLRPTTRAPVLVCHPADMTWFTEANLLPGLLRTASATTDPSTLQVVSAQALLPGLALLDAPDIDSVVDANRAMANQLLAAADLWLFVTTASRYADAVPWSLLQTARNRGTAIALVLDRVPGGGAVDEIGPHLTGMLREHDLGGVPLFVLPEMRLDSQGLLVERVVAPLRDWFSSLARSASVRADVVRQTVGGAIDALDPAVAELAGAADDQMAAAKTLQEAVRSAYRAANSSVEQGIHDGALLRGEVLARWQELVGTGDIMRALQARVGHLRDRLVAAITGRPAPGERFQEALESGLVTLLRAAATDAAERAGTAWRAHPAGKALLAMARTGALDPQPATGAHSHAGIAPMELTAPGPELTERIARLVRDWQRSVLDLVRGEAGDKRALARASAYVVNATGLLVMVAVFTATAFIPTGAEVAIAGGTTVAAQKILEAIFGDQAVRALAQRARDDLLERVHGLLESEAARYHTAIAAVGIDEGVAERLREAAQRVERAREQADLPVGGGLPMPTVDGEPNV